MAVFAIAVATGDIIKYQSFVYVSFVWEIHVRYNNMIYAPVYIMIYIQSNLVNLQSSGLEVYFELSVVRIIER